VSTIVFVVGTGTDVGKTYVTSALSAAARAPAWKPITSGGLDDVAALASDPPLHALSAPLSPHLAARRDGVAIDAKEVARAVLVRAERHSLYFVESAGGLYSPISETQTNADIVRALAPHARSLRVVLVAPDRLGVLHDVGATVRAARADGIGFACIALSAPEHGDASTGTNAEELVRIGLGRAVVMFPRGAPSLPAAECLRALGITVT
jgi:dethiobiotin synthetase